MVRPWWYWSCWKPRTGWTPPRGGRPAWRRSRRSPPGCAAQLPQGGAASLGWKRHDDVRAVQRPYLLKPSRCLVSRSRWNTSTLSTTLSADPAPRRHSAKCAYSLIAITGRYWRNARRAARQAVCQHATCRGSRSSALQRLRRQRMGVLASHHSTASRRRRSSPEDPRDNPTISSSTPDVASGSSRDAREPRPGRWPPRRPCAGAYPRSRAAPCGRAPPLTWSRWRRVAAVAGMPHRHGRFRAAAPASATCRREMTGGGRPDSRIRGTCRDPRPARTSRSRGGRATCPSPGARARGSPDHAHPRPGGPLAGSDAIARGPWRPRPPSADDAIAEILSMFQWKWIASKLRPGSRSIRSWTPPT